MDKQFQDAQRDINEYDQRIESSNKNKARESFINAKNKLTKIKHDLVKKMHDKNLLSPQREKGTNLYS